MLAQPPRQRHPPDPGRRHGRGRRASATPTAVVLSVTDGCGGIPEEDLPRVFDTGWRGTARPDARPAGAGLGLAIVRGIVEAHHGRAAVRNVPGGCRFEVACPRPPRRPSRPRTRLHGRRSAAAALLARAAPRPVARGGLRADRRRAAPRELAPCPRRSRPAASSPARRAAGAEAAVMCRTSPSRYSPGDHRRRAAAAPRPARAAISPTVCGSPLPMLYAVQRARRRGRAVQRRHVGRRHVPHVDEVPPLAAVLEDPRRLAAGQRGPEEGGDARVRGVARHARPVHVVVAQRRPPGRRSPRAQAAARCSWASLVAAYTLRGSSGRVLADQARASAVRAARAGSGGSNRPASQVGRRRAGPGRTAPCRGQS